MSAALEDFSQSPYVASFFYWGRKDANDGATFMAEGCKTPCFRPTVMSDVVLALLLVGCCSSSHFLTVSVCALDGCVPICPNAAQAAS